MNYQRFGWHEDRSYPGRDDLEAGRYPRRDYGRYDGGDGRGDGQRGMRGSEGYGNGDYDDRDFYRDRDEMGRFTGRMWNDDRYGGYKSGKYYDQGPDRDDMGRFTERPTYGREGHSTKTHGMGYGEQERDNMGRFSSGGAGRRRYAMQGPHTGRGPKNYQRSEERVKEDVSDELEQDGFLDASEIEIKVKEGIVTLTGTVQSRDEKRRAEEIAESCPGVKDVQNQLRVTGSSQSTEQHQSGTYNSGQQQQQQGNRKSA